MPRPEFRLHLFAAIQLREAFPSLQDHDWKIKSPIHRDYNCHAWGVCETRVRWEPTPDDYWPPGLRTGDISDYCLQNFLRAYTTVGFRECPTKHYEFGYQKIAIYSDFDSGEEWPQHTARQTLFGRGWLSKLGDAEDIWHKSLADLEGDKYGRVVRYMKRSWKRALLDPSSTWFSATMRNFIYRVQRPQGI